MPLTRGRQFKKKSNIVNFFHKRKTDENSNSLPPLDELEKTQSENERKDTNLFMCDLVLLKQFISKYLKCPTCLSSTLELS